MDLKALIAVLQQIDGQQPQDPPKEEPKDAPQDPKDKPEDQPKEEPKDKPEDSKDKPQDPPKEEPKDKQDDTLKILLAALQQQPKAETKVEPKTPEKPKDEPKAESKTDPMAQVLRTVLINQAGVPEVLQPLLPQEIDKLQTFLGSDQYKTLKTAVESTKTIQEPKDDAPKPGKPPKDKSDTAPKAKTFKDISLDDLKSFGEAFI